MNSTPAINAKTWPFETSNESLCQRGLDSVARSQPYTYALVTVKDQKHTQFFIDAAKLISHFNENGFTSIDGQPCEAAYFFVMKPSLTAELGYAIATHSYVSQWTAVEKAVRHIFSYEECIDAQFKELEQQLELGDKKAKSALVYKFQQKYPKHIPLYKKWFFYLVGDDLKNVETGIDYTLKMIKWMGTCEQLELTLSYLYLMSGKKDLIAQALSKLNTLMLNNPTRDIPAAIWFEAFRVLVKCSHMPLPLLIRFSSFILESTEAQKDFNRWDMQYKVCFLLASRYRISGDPANAIYWLKRMVSYVPQNKTIVEKDALLVIEFYFKYFIDDQKFYSALISKLPMTESVRALLASESGECAVCDSSETTMIAEGLYRLKLRQLTEITDFYSSIKNLPQSLLRWKFLLLYFSIAKDRVSFKQHEKLILGVPVQVIPHKLRLLQKMYATWNIDDDAVDIALKAAQKYPDNFELLDAVLEIVCKSHKIEQRNCQQIELIRKCATTMVALNAYHPSAHFILGSLENNKVSARPHFIYATRCAIPKVRERALRKAFPHDYSEDHFSRPLSENVLQWKKALHQLSQEGRLKEEEKIVCFPQEEIPFIFSNLASWYREWGIPNDILRVAYYLEHAFPQNLQILTAILQFFVTVKKIDFSKTQDPVVSFIFRCAKNVFAQDPENCEANLVFGRVCTSEDYAKASNHYMLGQRKDAYRDSAELAFLICITRSMTSKNLTAYIPELQRMLPKFPSYDKLRFVLAKALIANGQFFAAEELLQPLLIKGKNFDVLFILAVGCPFEFLEKKKSYVISALSTVKSEKNRSQNSTVLQRHAARILLNENKVELAKKHLALAIQSPLDIVPRRELLTLLLDEQNIDFERIRTLFLEIRKHANREISDPLFIAIAKRFFTVHAYAEVEELCSALADDFSLLPMSVQVMYCFSLCVLGKGKQVYESIPMSCCTKQDRVREFFDIVKELTKETSHVTKYLLYGKSRNLGIKYPNLALISDNICDYIDFSNNNIDLNF